jgi:hypothetical protein
VASHGLSDAFFPLNKLQKKLNRKINWAQSDDVPPR